MKYSSNNNLTFINERPYNKAKMMKFSNRQTKGNETTEMVPGTAINDVSSQPRDEFEHLPLNFTEPPSPGAYSVPGIGEVRPWPLEPSLEEDDDKHEILE